MFPSPAQAVAGTALSLCSQAEPLGRIALMTGPAFPSPNCQSVPPAPQRLATGLLVVCWDTCMQGFPPVLPYYCPIFSWRT